MMDFIQDNYLWIKALHIIAVISWMAGMLYLPRLFVYHTQVSAGSESYKLFCVMEYRLLRYIINPAMIASFILGLLMIYGVGFGNFGKWLHVKLFALIILTAAHGMLARHRKAFASGANNCSTTYFRILNEVPTLCMIVIVIFAVVKPF